MKKARRRHIFYECKIIIASTIAVWLSCTSTTQKHQHSDILQLSQVHQRNLIIVRHIEPHQLLEWLANRALLTYPNQPIMLIILRQSEAQRINNNRVKQQAQRPFVQAQTCCVLIKRIDHDRHRPAALMIPAYASPIACNWALNHDWFGGMKLSEQRLPPCFCALHPGGVEGGHTRAEVRAWTFLSQCAI